MTPTFATIRALFLEKIRKTSLSKSSAFRLYWYHVEFWLGRYGVGAMIRAKSDRKFLARQLNWKLTGPHTVQRFSVSVLHCARGRGSIVQIFQMC